MCRVNLIWTDAVPASLARNQQQSIAISVFVELRGRLSPLHARQALLLPLVALAWADDQLLLQKHHLLPCSLDTVIVP